jgi:hypothetical protein
VEDGDEGGRAVGRRRIERKEGVLVRRRTERGSEEDGEEEGREVVRKWVERNKG